VNGKRISVSPEADFSKTLLVTGFPYNARENPDHCIDHFVNFLKRGRPVRRLGSAALDLAYVASGRLDGFWEVSLNPWDVAAGSLLLTEAGGTITDMRGEPWGIYTPSLIASNGKIHDEMLKTILQATK
jgi:myo-inositol-1(or 4)-monophosphatase